MHISLLIFIEGAIAKQTKSKLPPIRADYIAKIRASIASVHVQLAQVESAVSLLTDDKIVSGLLKPQPMETDVRLQISPAIVTVIYCSQVAQAKRRMIEIYSQLRKILADIPMG